MKKNLQIFKSRSLFGLLLLVLIFSKEMNAQLPQYYNYNVAGGANSFPFNQPNGKQTQWLYLPGDFNQPTAAPAGTVTSISFRINENYPFGPWTYSNFTIKLGQSPVTTFTTGVFYTGLLDTVYYKASVTFTGTPGQWLTITLDKNFVYNPSLSLIVDVSQCGAPGATGFAMCQTTLSGLRRNYSVAGCPFTWTGSNNAVAHIGFNICTTASCVPTGVQNLTEQVDNSISLFPNPATNLLNIQTDKTIDGIVVMDITGRKVLEQNGNISQINIQSLQQGMYQLIINSDGRSTSHKFIKE
jgi:hypothetical protein